MRTEGGKEKRKTKPNREREKTESQIQYATSWQLKREDLRIVAFKLFELLPLFGLG